MKKIIGIFAIIFLFVNLISMNVLSETDSTEKPSVIRQNQVIIDMIVELDEEMVIEYIENLTSFGPRWKGTEECHEAGRYIYNEFLKMGLDVRYDNFSFEYYGEPMDGFNVEATLYGKDPNSDKIYILCGHYDSWKNSPGADDNGAGIAAILSAANIMRNYDFNHTIRFVAFDAEENGHFGSYHYVKDCFENNTNIIAALNADMMGFYKTQEGSSKVTVHDDEDDWTESVWLTDFAEEISLKYYEYINLEVYRGGYIYWSDHENFWEFGYDAIMYFEYEYELNPYYHTSQDIIKNMKPDYATNVSKLTLATLCELSGIYSNNKPDMPYITGENEGKFEEEYTYNIVTLDPNDDNVFYFVDWGDNQTADWIGPYNSGQSIDINHIWVEQGYYIIRVKAKDIYDEESEWATLEVSMPKQKISNQIPKILMWLFERFPFLESLF
ncbi:M28 family metallopeptidase [Thermoplasmatota archaeon]